MEYLLLVHVDPTTLQALRQAEMTTALAAYGAYTESLHKAGIAKGGNRLRHADTATTVRVKGGKTEVHNGPFIETREQLGGYYLIDVPDLDTALAWAARCPGSSHGAVEVRAVWPMGEA